MLDTLHGFSCSVYMIMTYSWVYLLCNIFVLIHTCTFWKLNFPDRNLTKRFYLSSFDKIASSLTQNQKVELEHNFCMFVKDFFQKNPTKTDEKQNFSWKVNRIRNFFLL